METPPHEEENRQKVEPSFVSILADAFVATNVTNQKQTHGSKSKLKEQKDPKDSKSGGSNKRVASTTGRKSSKRGENVDGGVTKAPIDDPSKDVANDVVESDSKVDPVSASNSARVFGIKGNVG